MKTGHIDTLPQYMPMKVMESVRTSCKYSATADGMYRKIIQNRYIIIALLKICKWSLAIVLL
jgi:hypothetical protein